MEQNGDVLKTKTITIKTLFEREDLNFSNYDFPVKTKYSNSLKNKVLPENIVSNVYYLMIFYQDNCII